MYYDICMGHACISVTGTMGVPEVADRLLNYCCILYFVSLATMNRESIRWPSIASMIEGASWVFNKLVTWVVPCVLGLVGWTSLAACSPQSITNSHSDIRQKVIDRLSQGEVYTVKWLDTQWQALLHVVWRGWPSQEEEGLVNSLYQACTKGMQLATMLWCTVNHGWRLTITLILSISGIR